MAAGAQRIASDIEDISGTPALRSIKLARGIS
jgi:hypothetical protein